MAIAMGPAKAQTVDTAYSEAFADRIATPGDTNALNTFINVAVREGQYDQAISTVEQHLISAPRDAKARLVAGRLYLQVSSYELARRQLQHALSIGTLSADETAEAQMLLDRVERALSGWTYGVAASAGLRFEHVDRGAGGSDEFVTGFGALKGFVRQDLRTPTRDAIIYSGGVEITERITDTNIAAAPDQSTYVDGGAKVTYDKGLPTEHLDSLRMQVSAFAGIETFDSNVNETAFGTSLRFTARPTVDGLVFIGGGYANLDASDGIFTEDRWFWEAGYTHRLPNGHTIGGAVRGTQDSGSGQSDLGHLVEGEIRYGGVVFADPNSVIWLHELGVAVGERETPDLTRGPTVLLSSDHWRISSMHDFQWSDAQKISLDLTYSEVDYSGNVNDRDSFAATLYFTHTFQ